MAQHTMTINIDAKLEKDFRQLAASLYGTRKGSLGKAVSVAFADFVRHARASSAIAFALRKLEEGYDLGGGPYYSSRDELHERH